MAVYGNYFVAIYIQEQTICKVKRKKNKKRKKKIKTTIIESLHYYTLLL